MWFDGPKEAPDPFESGAYGRCWWGLEGLKEPRRIDPGGALVRQRVRSP